MTALPTPSPSSTSDHLVASLDSVTTSLDVAPAPTPPVCTPTPAVLVLGFSVLSPSPSPASPHSASSPAPQDDFENASATQEATPLLLVAATTLSDTYSRASATSATAKTSETSASTIARLNASHRFCLLWAEGERTIGPPEESLGVVDTGFILE